MTAAVPGPVSPLVLFEAALGGSTVTAMHLSDPVPVDVAAWTAERDAVDEAIVALCEGPVLDVGCGPGRFAAALAARGVPALRVIAGFEEPESRVSQILTGADTRALTSEAELREATRRTGVLLWHLLALAPEAAARMREGAADPGPAIRALSPLPA